MKNNELFIDGEIPKRLSNKEVLVLFDRMKQGDMKAREELISGNIDLVIQCVKNNFNDVCCDKRELVAVGCLGLIKGIDNFDMLKHKYFSTHIGNYIHREIEYFINRLNKDSNILSFDDGFNGVKLKDNLSDDVSIEEMFEEKDYNNYMYGLLQQSMNCLNERSKKIIMLYFGFYDGKIYTHREIADMMNVSHTRIYEIMNDSLEHMKENIQRLELGNEPIRKRQLNIRTIYELLSDYTREEIDEIIEELSDEDKELLRLRYGNDLDNPVSIIDHKNNGMFNSYLVPKMKKILACKVGFNNKSNKLQTIYELLGDYTREEIDKVISELSDEDKELLRLRYGNDLDNPVSTIDYEQRCKFYSCLYPKMKRLLAKTGNNENTLEDSGTRISCNDLFICDVFFKELTKKEVLALLRRLRQGDMKAREELITKNIGLVIQYVKNNFMDVCYDKKELVAIGCLGLVKAVDIYSKSDDRDFLLYAKKCINEEINMFLKELNTYQDKISFDDIIYPDKFGNNVKLRNILLSKVDMERDYIKKIYDDAQLKLLQQSMECLNERNRRIISLYFGFVDGKRYSVFEISNMMPVSTTYIYKLIKESLGKLRENMQLLENGMEAIKDDNCKKKLRTIYELLSDYTREEINEMIEELSDEDKELLRLRYGNDLDNPVSAINFYERVRFYTYLVRKMERLLSNRGNTLKRSKNK